MPKPRVYVETTIPSFYYDFRDSPAVVSRREATRRWWESGPEWCELVTSTTVRDELAAGSSAAVARRLQMIAALPILPAVPAVLEIVGVYLRHKLMPARPPEDAMHLALASFYTCDFILTWNCRHLANPNKALHIRRINTALGSVSPRC